MLILLGGGVFLLLTSQSKDSQQTSNKTPEINVKKEEQAPVNIKDEDEDIATLSAVGDYTGSATATRVFSRSVFIHTISADIPDPAEGKFYEGWLVKNEPTLELFSTGKLTKQNDRYMLNYRTDTDYFDYTNIVVTEETESLGLDGNPETHVLEGSF